MSLKGIDISNYQSTLDAGKIAADFVICKATEGVGYVNPSCDKHYQQAKKAGKKLGVYHFARNRSNDAIKEANYFVKNIRGYVGEAVLILDWEDDGGVSDTAWAKRWLDRVKELTGVKPMIYMSESVVNAHNWSAVVAGDYGLWVAKYRDNTADVNYNMANAGAKPSIKWWSFYVMWQWTSSGRLDGYAGNLDCNEFYGDKSTWDAYAGKKATPPAPKPEPKPEPKPIEFVPMQVPRVMIAKKDLKKFNADKRAYESDVTLPATDGRLFLTKFEVDGVLYLRTEADTDADVKRGFKFDDMQETRVYDTSVALTLRALNGKK